MRHVPRDVYRTLSQDYLKLPASLRGHHAALLDHAGLHHTWGRIPGARHWAPEQFRVLFGFKRRTLAKLLTSKPLLAEWDGDDLVVHFYDRFAQEAMEQASLRGRRGALAMWYPHGAPPDVRARFPDEYRDGDPAVENDGGESMGRANGDRVPIGTSKKTTCTSRPKVVTESGSTARDPSIDAPASACQLRHATHEQEKKKRSPLPPKSPTAVDGGSGPEPEDRAAAASTIERLRTATAAIMGAGRFTSSDAELLVRTWRGRRGRVDLVARELRSLEKDPSHVLPSARELAERMAQEWGPGSNQARRKRMNRLTPQQWLAGREWLADADRAAAPTLAGEIVGELLP